MIPKLFCNREPIHGSRVLPRPGSKNLWWLLFFNDCCQFEPPDKTCTFVCPLISRPGTSCTVARGLRTTAVDHTNNLVVTNLWPTSCQYATIATCHQPPRPLGVYLWRPSTVSISLTERSELAHNVICWPFCQSESNLSTASEDNMISHRRFA